MTDDELHRAYMRRCLDLAATARAAGNVPVGALIVLGGQMIASASETLPQSTDVTGHAELLAIRAACQALGRLDLAGATLYTTAEPCWMYSYAIRETHIGTVVIGAETPDVGGISTRYPLLVDGAIAVWGPPPQIVAGILRDACAAMRG